MNFVKFLWYLRAQMLRLILGAIGARSYIGKPIYITGFKKIFLGKKFRLYPNSRVEVYSGGRLVIGDNVAIGQNFHLICSNRVEISSGCLISANVFVTDTDHSFEIYDVPVHEQPNRCFETKIGRNCFVGYGAVIQAGSIIGDNCVIGANSTVKGNFRNGSIIVGSPAREIRNRLLAQNES